MRISSNECDIYMGAIPWIFIQLILVAIVIGFPQTLTVFLDKEKVLDLDKASEQIQQMGGGRSQTQTLELPAAAAPGGASTVPAPANEDPKEAVKGALDADTAKK